jgi:hypothetical protein
VVEDGDYYVVAGATGNMNHVDNDLTIGQTDNINAGGDYWVLQIDTGDFSVNWQRNFHGDNPGSNDTTYSDFARSIAVTHAGNYIVSGFCESCEPNKQQQQSMLVKLNTSGNTIFKYDYGDESIHYYQRDQGCHSIIETHEGSNYRYVGTGVAHPDTCFNAKSHDVYVLKSTTAGNDFWTPGCKLDEGKEYGGNKPDEGYAVTQTCDWGYLVAGSVKSKANDITCNNGGTGNYTYDAWLLKLDTAGVKEWDESLGSTYNDEAHSIKELWDVTYIMAGEFGADNFNQKQNVYVIQFELDDCPARLQQQNTFLTTKELLSIYPNPTEGTAKISIRLTEKISQTSTIYIFEPVGKIIQTFNVSMENGLLYERLILTGLNAGFYLVKITVGGQLFQGKLIIE